MPWRNDEASRKRSNVTYGAAWRKARDRAMRRDNWRCQARLEGCTGAATQVDHIVPVAQGGRHDLPNLRSICTPCHHKVTAQQGGGFRTPARTDPAPAPRTQW